MSTLVLTAHGSADPRSAANAQAVAGQLRRVRPNLDVRLAFCELNAPRLVEVLTPDAVVTPFLLADAYHARIDIPRQIAGCGVTVRQAGVLGEDDRLVAVLHERLVELGVSPLDPELGVLVVAIGSTHAAPTPAPPRSLASSPRALSGLVRQPRSPPGPDRHRPSPLNGCAAAAPAAS